MAILFFSVSTLSAEENFSFWGKGETFKLNPITDTVLLGSGLILTGSGLFLEKFIEPKYKIKFDGALLNEADINAFDRPFVNAYSKTLDKTADIFLYTGLCAPAFLALCNPPSEWSTLVITYGEAFLLQEGIHTLLKYVVNRPRPYMYKNGYPQEDIDNGNWNKSFPSGHVTRIFTAAAYASYMFCSYYPESPWRFMVIGASYAFAFTTAALRIASGNHFLSDVIAGAAIGSICGFGVPVLHQFGLNTSDEKKGLQKKSFAVTPFGCFLTLKF